MTDSGGTVQSGGPAARAATRSPSRCRSTSRRPDRSGAGRPDRDGRLPGHARTWSTRERQVVGDARLVETRTSEIATNVTAEQIRNLPQNHRNFLNFAALAPGVRVPTTRPARRSPAARSPPQQTNVFIDGVSYKNDILDGGVVGQDSSRGNPFPQNAVQEFRVLTQNYKAEYEKASSAIITAVTKSGGNSWTRRRVPPLPGQGPGGERGRLVARTPTCDRRRPKPTYERFQGGVARRPDRRGQAAVLRLLRGEPAGPRQRVLLRRHARSRRASNACAPTRARSRSPFRSQLVFAKLTCAAAARAARSTSATACATRPTSASFGDQRSFEAAENVRNRVDTVLGTLARCPATALAQRGRLTFQRYQLEPAAGQLTDRRPGLQGVLRIGGRDTEQLFVQDRSRCATTSPAS